MAGTAIAATNGETIDAAKLLDIDEREDPWLKAREHQANTSEGQFGGGNKGSHDTRRGREIVDRALVQARGRSGHGTRAAGRDRHG